MKHWKGDQGPPGPPGHEGAKGEKGLATVDGDAIRLVLRTGRQRSHRQAAKGLPFTPDVAWDEVNRAALGMFAIIS
jgi:hypothetical protein